MGNCNAFFFKATAGTNVQCLATVLFFTRNSIHRVQQFFFLYMLKGVKKVNACAMKNDSLDVLVKGLWTKLSSAPTVNKP